MPRHAEKLKSFPPRDAEFIEPMECLPVAKLPEGSQWAYEIRLDGYRAVAVKSAGKVKLYSRRRKSFNTQYPYLIDALRDLPENSVVDGEVVALDDSGKPDFRLLQEYRKQASRIHYFICLPWVIVKPPERRKRQQISLPRRYNAGPQGTHE